MATPKFYAVQEEGVIDNALFIVTRDFKSILDQFNPTQAALDPDDPQYMEDFQERTLGQILRIQFPCFALGPNRNAIVAADANDRLAQAVRFDMYAGVVDDTAAHVTVRLMRYMSALDITLRSALKSDWKRNMSVQTFGVVLNETEHVYGPIRERESIYFRDALLQATLLFNEQ